MLQLTKSLYLRRRYLNDPIPVEGALSEPCLVAREITTLVDIAEDETYYCQIQGGDADSLGPRMLTIDGLTPEWASKKKLISGRSTLFIEGTSIRGSRIDLPPGKTVEDVTIDVCCTNHEGSASLEDSSLDHDSSKDRLSRRLLVSGNKEVIAIRVQAANVATSASEAELSDILFGTSGAEPTFASQYAAVSFNQVTFSGTTDTTRFPGVNNGVYTVNIGTTIVSGSTQKMMLPLPSTHN